MSSGPLQPFENPEDASRTRTPSPSKRRRRISDVGSNRDAHEPSTSRRRERLPLLVERLLPSPTNPEPLLSRSSTPKLTPSTSDFYSEDPFGPFVSSTEPRSTGESPVATDTMDTQVPDGQGDPLALMAKMFARLMEQHVSQAPALAPAPRRMQMVDPERFSGEDKRLYMPFKQTMQAKMRIDGWAFPDGQIQCDYILTRLSGDASIKSTTWVANTRVEDKTADAFWTHLDSRYTDPQEGLRALNKLQSFTQGKQTVSSYTMNFDTTFERIPNPGAFDTDHTVKIMWYKRGLNDEIVAGMTGIVPPTDYRKFVDHCRLIEQQIIERKTRQPFSPWVPTQANTTTAASPDAMDWQSDPIAAAQPVGQPKSDIDSIVDRVIAALGNRPPANRNRKGKFPQIAPEVREHRRANNLCFGCGQPGHRSNACPDKQSVTVVAATVASPQPEKGEPSS